MIIRFFIHNKNLLAIILVWTLVLSLIGFFFIGSLSKLWNLITTAGNNLIENLFLGMLGISLLYTVVLILRTIRWQFLLKHQNYNLPPIFLAKVVWFAWAINSVTTPLRIGELQRVYMLKKHANVPYSTTTSSIIVEKFFDLFGLFFVFAIGTLIISFQFKILDESVNIIFWLGIFILFLSLLILSMIIFDKHYMALLQRLPLKNKTTRLYYAFQEARKSLLKTPKEFFFILLLSVLQWLIESLTILWIAWLFSFVNGVNSITAIMFGAVAGYATFIIPISPGSFGTFELSVSYIVFLLLNIKLNLFFQVPLITHIYVVLYLAITGIFALVILKFEKNVCVPFSSSSFYYRPPKSN